ncbi:neutral zinc metallopeptidase [Streptosporangium sp. NBC_01756]|uniref:neutral zinc metallopeptidase n=1 Tax=Streptosporangium sp. NBC_01756 TaxID=2975950 RepID=UPI002DDBD93F|nr:neutral zinc metallopeptidase [Streptosporangium sp. NBC_01756]WSC89530.1 neutral zinc metallopeptidase [Streptosporangium sp. NBC_01756]
MSITMKIRMIMVSVGASVLLVAGTTDAFAYPVKDAPDLTNNSLYAAGKLPAAKCAKKPAKGKTLASVKKHVNAVVACMNDTWGPYLKEAGLSYLPPRMEITTQYDMDCRGRVLKADKSAAFYCGRGANFIVQIRPDWLKASDDVQIFAQLSSAYGEHVLNLVDIAEGYNALHADDGAEMSEQLRRYNTQAQCMSGVTAKSLWSALGYPAKEAGRLVSLAKAGGDKGKVGMFGQGSNLAYWVNRGYSTGNPKSCNTWTAPAGKVA